MKVIQGNLGKRTGQSVNIQLKPEATTPNGKEYRTSHA